MVAEGVYVIVILLDAEVLFWEKLKKGAPPAPSFLELTSIFIPPDGMAEVTCTINGKLGPGAGASVVPLAGVVCTVRRVSVLSLPFFFLQAGVAIKTMAAIDKNRIFFMILV